jgi:putative hydrolase of the HAD superfamily
VKIEAILFDLGKVLVDFNFETGLQALHSACSISRSRLEDVLWDENCIRRYERGEISTSEFHTYLRETADLKMDLDCFCRTWSSVFLPDLIVSEQLLAALKRNYPLILVSNTNELHIDFVRSNYRVLDYFDHYVLSYEVGALKPDVRSSNRPSRCRGVGPRLCFSRTIGKKTSRPQLNSASTPTSSRPCLNWSLLCSKWESRFRFNNSLHSDSSDFAS